MIITSEITGKQYKTVDACIEDERKFIAEQEEKKKKQNEAKKKVDAAAKELDRAWAAYNKALDEAEIKLSPAQILFDFFERMY